jgi:YtkA-like
MNRSNLSLSFLLALSLAACGDDKTPDSGHDHDAHVEPGDTEPDGGYPDTPCDPNLPPLAPGLETLGSMSKLLKATLVSSDPTPLLKGRANWVVDFATAEGAPVSDLEFIDVFTYMPVHGHQGNFKPKAMQLSEPGRYAFDGLNFTMRGPWQVRFEVSSPTAGDDFIIVNVCVEDE